MVLRRGARFIRAYSPCPTAIAGLCPAPSRSRQPPRGFLPSTGTFSCPKPGRPGGRGVSGERQPPGFPCMGSISCTKTETKPNASDSRPFFVCRLEARAGTGAAAGRARPGVGSGPSDCNASRDDPFPSPLSYFVELFRNKALVLEPGRRSGAGGGGGNTSSPQGLRGGGGWEQLRFCQGKGFAVAGLRLSPNSRRPRGEGAALRLLLAFQRLCSVLLRFRRQDGAVAPRGDLAGDTQPCQLPPTPRPQLCSLPASPQPFPKQAGERRGAARAGGTPRWPPHHCACSRPPQPGRVRAPLSPRGWGCRKRQVGSPLPVSFHTSCNFFFIFLKSSHFIQQ